MRRREYYEIKENFRMGQKRLFGVKNIERRIRNHNFKIKKVLGHLKIVQVKKRVVRNMAVKVEQLALLKSEKCMTNYLIKQTLFTQVSL